MKAYFGLAPGRVLVHDGEHITYLHQHTRHSPDGHSWGYAGSGPAQLALDLLWDVLGSEPPPAMYQAFKADVVARWPMDTDWRMDEADIRDWVANYHLANSLP